MPAAKAERGAYGKAASLRAEALVERYQALLAPQCGRAADCFTDDTPGAVAARAASARRLAAQIRTAQRYGEIGEIDAAIMQLQLDAAQDAHRFDTARIPFTGDSGVQSLLAFEALTARLGTERAAKSYLAKLEDGPRHIDDAVANMRRGLQTGWTAHADPLATAMGQLEAFLAPGELERQMSAPLERLPQSWSEAEQADYRMRAEAALPALRAAHQRLLDFWRLDYAPEARTGAGLASLGPEGRDAYRAAVRHHIAGAGLSPDEIHQLGRNEVARIRGEMRAVMREDGFEGTIRAYIDELKADPSQYAQTPAELIAYASFLSKQLDAMLPGWFHTLPRLPYGVSPVPAAIAPTYTTGRYSQGDAEAGRAGTYLVNTYALGQRPLYALPALTAHEAVPGHHLQIALAQEMRDVAEFRRSYYATAFGEGWALYAERLAGEGGLYDTPEKKFGALSYEMWRACRLVSDTGLHWLGWTREEATRCFAENTALSPLNIQVEVTRYIGWPGQAVAYKVGEMKIMELRARARDRLGPRFDLRAFHDTILEEGAVPLDVLERRVDAWIEAETRADPAGD